LRRIELEEKNWKFSPGDLKERKLWDKYQVCYQDAINRTSTKQAPWYIIPADHKPSARYIVAKTIYDKLKEFDDIDEPELSDKIKENLAQYKKELNEE
jgi:polyphosphate kinase 2 (PPK2 family)